MQIAEKYRICTEALARYAHNAGFSEALIGLSGGIDSSVVAVMACDAFGAHHVHGVLLPGPYSSSHSVEDAQALAENLGIDVQSISICEPFEAFEKVLARACGGTLSGIAAENTQARCRMVCLMALSNAHGWMLVNTGNKSEAAMGYSTLYGDTAGAFAPLGGLYKTDVYALGKWRNEHAAEYGSNSDALPVPADAPIPERIFTKPPSAELSPNQRDEVGMGIEYKVLDTLLIAACETGLSIDESASKAGISVERARELIARVESYAFKRAMEPPFPDAKFYE